MSHSNRFLASAASLLGLLGMLMMSPVSANTTAVKPAGEFAKIDTRLANETIQVLNSGTAEEKRKTIAQIKARPENYAPPVFYALSSALFSNGEKDDAAFWFYAGQVRARVDANICADASARQAVSVLNRQYGAPINQHAFQDIPKLEALVSRVVDWERKTPYNYDRRWINLHGMKAVMSGMGTQSPEASAAPLSLPREQWSDIAEKTRVDYLSNFRNGMSQMKSRK